MTPIPESERSRTKTENDAWVLTIFARRINGKVVYVYLY